MRSAPFAAAALALSVALGLTACAPGSSGPTTGGAPDPDAVLTVGLVLEPTDLDIRRTAGVALEQALIDNVYQGLVGRTADQRVVDVLATSHEVSADGLTYTFALRDDVTFAGTGDAMTAEDVVWSLQQVRDDESFVGHDDLAAVVDVAAPDASTVVLTLSRPDSQLLWALTGRAGLVLEEGATNDLSTSSNGTGPFEVSRWTQGDNLQLTRVDDAWGEPAGVAGVTFRYLTDRSAAVNAVLAGDVDVQTAVDATLRSQLDGAEGVTVTEGRTTDKYTLAFNSAVAPFTDERVRKALRMAIDDDAVIAAVGGAGVPQGGPVPELDPGHEDLTDVDAYDPDAARALLEEAGATDLELSLVYANHYPTAIGDVLTTQLADVGVTLDVQQVEFATWLQRVFQDHDYELSMVDHAESHDLGIWADPDYYFGFDDPEVQSLYAAALATTDPEAAEAGLAATARAVSEAAPAEWLYTATALTAVRDGVEGFPTDATTARLDLTEVTKAG